MQVQNNLLQIDRRTSPIKLALPGAIIALVLIALFLLSAGEPNPAWPRFWMIRPLIIVPIAGAFGALPYYFLQNLGYKGGRRKVLIVILCCILYIVALWLGTVLGLDGTMWN